MHFGATLRLLRIDAGLSLRALAQRIGVSSAYLSRVENGLDSIPTPDRLVEIARVLGLPQTLLMDLANKVDPFVSRYLEQVPAANTLFLEIARRNLTGAQIARVKAFIDAEFPAGAGGLSAPKPLSARLTPDQVILHLTCTEIEDAVDIAASRLVGAGSALSAGKVAKAMLQREEEGSTALGHGVAVPHAILPGAPSSAVLVTLAQPVPASTPDRLPLRLLVMLLDAAGGQPHLEMLAQVARLANPQVVESLCQADTPARLLEQLRQQEAWYG